MFVFGYNLMYEPGAGLGGRGLGARAGGLGRGGLLGGRGLGGRRLGGGDVEDVQDATGSWLDGGVFGWVVGDVVAIDDVLSHLLTSIGLRTRAQIHCCLQ